MTIELAPEEGILGRLLAQPDLAVRRIAFDVGSEQVVFVLREGRMSAMCTCGVDGCEHFGVVLGLVGEAKTERSAAARTAAAVASLGSSERVAESLSGAFEELCLAVARTGVLDPDSPSVTAALEQLLAVAPKPLPTVLSRWAGRFRDALGFGDVGKVARLLDGACVSTRMWSGKDAGVNPFFPQAGLSPTGADLSESISEVTLIEVAREWVRGVSRGAIERRYLVELLSGEVFCEERARGEFRASVGPCPRGVYVAFGEVESATRPRRARLLQYTVTPALGDAQWRRLAELGETNLAALSALYVECSGRSPGFSEPFVLLSPKLLHFGTDSSLCDQDGHVLALRDDDDRPQEDVLRALSADGELVWVSGRLLGRSRGIVLRPTSLLVRVAGQLRLRRVT